MHCHPRQSGRNSARKVHCRRRQQGVPMSCVASRNHWRPPPSRRDRRGPRRAPPDYRQAKGCPRHSGFFPAQCEADHTALASDRLRLLTATRIRRGTRHPAKPQDRGCAACSFPPAGQMPRRSWCRGSCHCVTSACTDPAILRTDVRRSGKVNHANEIRRPTRPSRDNCWGPHAWSAFHRKLCGRAPGEKPQ